MAVRAAARFQRPGEPVATVLGYHQVTDRGSHLAVSRRTFEEQMGVLDEMRDELNPLPLNEIIARMARGTAPLRSVAVTFDDAWADVHENALGVLLEYRIPATLYVPTGYLDYPGFVSRSELQNMADAGIEIGAHTRTHPDLRGCTDAELESELAGSRADLEDLLSRKVDAFAYPSGLHDKRVVAAVARAGFRSAVTTTRGWLRPASDLLRIRRSFVEEFPLQTFTAGARGGMNVLKGTDALKAAMSRVSGRRPEGLPT
ncbi:MAG TPA: polysaccharide deacetylase family protein [Thermoleophilaceae bacterium]